MIVTFIFGMDKMQDVLMRNKPSIVANDSVFDYGDERRNFKLSKPDLMMGVSLISQEKSYFVLDDPTQVHFAAVHTR